MYEALDCTLHYTVGYYNLFYLEYGKPAYLVLLWYNCIVLFTLAEAWFHFVYLLHCHLNVLHINLKIVTIQGVYFIHFMMF